ncbi:hypothetical protein [Salinibacterium sp. ZJ77]|uniref:hypothetical protein n=1 Tax=Salinibacterium sp. ZJ77 TaxID=2708337 RepID=UPI00141EDACA|nr:hypothetical protein [Salinibacterium sp. ZJ77]
MPTLTLYAVGAVVAVLIASIIARRTVWSAASPSSYLPGSAVRRPRGTVAVGAAYVGETASRIPAQLADWHLRGVVRVERLGSDHASDHAGGSSPGPNWRFTLGDDAGLDEEERAVLTGIFPPDAPRGSEFVLVRHDQASRERMKQAIAEAERVRLVRAAPAFVWLAVTARVVAVAAMVVLPVSLATTDTGVAVASFFASAIIAAAVFVLTRRPLRLPEDERLFRAEVRDLGRAVKHGAIDPDPDLLGWAVLWNLPGEWADIAPDEVLELRWRETAFRPPVDLDVAVITP